MPKMFVDGINQISSHSLSTINTSRHQITIKMTPQETAAADSATGHQVTGPASITTRYPLKSGNGAIPCLGIGTYKSKPEDIYGSVKTAIATGYRLIDCAYDYGNETGIGEAIKDSIAEGVCTREELFVVTKIWNTFHSKKAAKKASSGLSIG